MPGKLHITEVANACGMHREALKQWLHIYNSVKLANPQFEGAWRTFSYADVAVFAIAHQLVNIGQTVPTAHKNAVFLVRERWPGLYDTKPWWRVTETTSFVDVNLSKNDDDAVRIIGRLFIADIINDAFTALAKGGRTDVPWPNEKPAVKRRDKEAALA
jgi:hypothetical protein